MSAWYKMYTFPVRLPDIPIAYNDGNFDALFVRTKVYDKLDKYIENIEGLHGTFWVSSPRGGFGKSTMLNYIVRELLKKLGELRALPIYIKIRVEPGETLDCAFIRGFVEAMVNLPDILSSMRGLSFPEDIREGLMEASIKELRKFKSRELPKKDSKELKGLFNQCLEYLRRGLRHGRYRKYVLLIDEMDKVDAEEVLGFLSRNQGLFEELYKEYEVVAFIAGHRPWVEQIHETTEYSFFQGDIFRLPPIVDIRDVKKLVNSRLIYFKPHMREADIPFNDEAYEKIRDLSKGIPRQIIRLAGFILNKAYEAKVPSIGPGFIDEVIIEDRLVNKLIPHLQSNSRAFEKIRRAIEAKVDNILYAIYDFSPSHELPKQPYDIDADKRARYLGLELTNNEWKKAIDKLLRLGCLEDVGDKKWKLTTDVSHLLDQIESEDYPVDKSKVVPLLIKKLYEVLPPEKQRVPEPSEEELLEAIERCFKIYPNKWLNEEQLLSCFRDTTVVTVYIQRKYPRGDFVKISKKLFGRYFKRFIDLYRNQILIWTEGDKHLYRKRPRQLPVDEFEKIKAIGDLDVINEYIDVLTRGDYTETGIPHLDQVIERFFICLGDREGTHIEHGFLRKNLRYEILRKLDIPMDIRKYIRAYINLTGGKSMRPIANPQIIRELFKQIIISVSSLIKERPGPIHPYVRDMKMYLEEAGRCIARNPETTIIYAFKAVMAALEMKIIKVKGMQVLENLRREKKLYMRSLVSTLEKAGVKLTNSIRNELDMLRDIRNKVEHEHYHPSEDEARWAFQLAKKTIRKLLPEVIRFLNV